MTFHQLTQLVITPSISLKNWISQKNTGKNHQTFHLPLIINDLQEEGKSERALLEAQPFL